MITPRYWVKLIFIILDNMTNSFSNIAKAYYENIFFHVVLTLTQKKSRAATLDFITLKIYMLNNGAITRLTIAITFIKIFIDGPDVSLKGSPTVSPTTAAA